MMNVPSVVITIIIIIIIIIETRGRGQEADGSTYQSTQQRLSNEEDRKGERLNSPSRR
jgi:hypothetical protein